MSLRDHINLIEASPDFTSMQDRKQVVLDALDRLLGCQQGTKGDKVRALREVESAAKRMADQIERHLRDAERQDDQRISQRRAP